MKATEAAGGTVALESYYDLLRAACDAVWVTDRNLRIVAFHRPGHPRDQNWSRTPVGQSLVDMSVHAGSDLEWYTRRQRPFRSVPILWTVQEMLVSGVPIYTKAGRFGGYRGVAVWERGADLAQTAHRLMKEYEDVALERNETLWQLGECRRHLKRCREAEGTLLHELRTPVNAARGYAELGRSRIENVADSQQIRITFDRIVEAADHMADLLQNSTVGTPAVGEKNKEGANLCETIKIACRLVQPLADRASVTLESPSFEVPKERRIPLSKQSLTQIIVNLLTNAAKFTPAGGSCGCRVTDVGSGFVRTTVWDTGPGIPVNEQERIFQRHYQSAPAETQKSGKDQKNSGLGLGLAISRELAQNVGGELHVHSEPSAGTAFLLELPILWN